MIKKFVKKLENWFLIQELVLTKQGETLVKDLENQGLSEDWISAILNPYDIVKKQNKIDKTYVKLSTQYFKQSL